MAMAKAKIGGTVIHCCLHPKLEQTLDQSIYINLVAVAAGVEEGGGEVFLILLTCAVMMIS